MKLCAFRCLISRPQVLNLPIVSTAFNSMEDNKKIKNGGSIDKLWNDTVSLVIPVLLISTGIKFSIAKCFYFNA